VSLETRKKVTASRQDITGSPNIYFYATGHRVLLLETICVSPVVFLAFAARETQAPERSGGERGGSHAYKGLKKTRGESMLEEGSPCDRLPVGHGSIRIFTFYTIHRA